jgi:MFS family permease
MNLKASFSDLKPNVRFMGIVSFLTDVSSEIIFPLLPLFLTNVLGAKTTIVGLVEGVGDSTATLLRIPSGILSDRIKKRKLLTVWGYSISTIAKPFMYFATSWGIAMGVRFGDRVGKGIRTAPRDALIADSIEDHERGKSFGFHRAMDTGGAVVGIAITAMVIFILQGGEEMLSLDTYRFMVLVAIVPAVLAVAVLLLKVKEKTSIQREEVRPPRAGKFPREFKIFILIMVLFTLGNSSDAFLVLRAQNLGFSILGVVMLLLLFNLTYALSSSPLGMLSDRWGRKKVIIGGWTVYALVYLGLGLASTGYELWALLVLYGLYYGATEGVSRALVADMVPPERRGEAYGFYHTAVGITVLPASIIAGILWDTVDPSTPFFLSAALSAISIALLVKLVKIPQRS